MKIGILTYHCADNYGAVLQCFALQEVLKRLGHEVEVINYCNPYVLKDYEYKFHLSEWLTAAVTLDVAKFAKYIPYTVLKRNRKKKFDSFRNKFLNVGELVKSNEIAQDYDRIIIGSDQMWTIACYKKYDPVYFGDFKRKDGCKLFGYAISSKGDFFMPLSAGDLNRLTSNFQNISFRETKIQQLVNLVTNRNYPQAIDPTLLTDSDIWEPMIDEKWADKNYVVTYQVRWPSSPNTYAVDRIAEQYAKEHGCSVIKLNSKGYSVEDFVSIIKYAKAVFTSSFHATVFSLIFNTPFRSYCLHDGNDDRYVNILKALSLEDHIMEINKSPEIMSKYDTDLFRKKIKELRKDSMDCIHEIIK